MTISEQTLKLIQDELSFISRRAGQIEGANSEDYAATDEIRMAVSSIREALAAAQLDEQPACETDILMTAEAEDRRLAA